MESLGIAEGSPEDFLKGSLKESWENWTYRCPCFGEPLARDMPRGGGQLASKFLAGLQIQGVS